MIGRLFRRKMTGLCTLGPGILGPGTPTISSEWQVARLFRACIRTDLVGRLSPEARFPDNSVRLPVHHLHYPLRPPAT
jgi:hypothetical protein